MSAAVYQHPDGHEITVGAGLLTACTSEGTAVSLPIGPAGLRDVAAKLQALADEVEMGGAHPANGPADKSAPHPGYGPDDIQF